MSVDFSLFFKYLGTWLLFALDLDPWRKHRTNLAQLASLKKKKIVEMRPKTFSLSLSFNSSLHIMNGEKERERCRCDQRFANGASLLFCSAKAKCSLSIRENKKKKRIFLVTH